MRVHPMWDNYPSIRNDLSKVLELIDSHIRVRDKTVEKTIKELIYSGGKLLRPSYSLLCSEIGPKKEKEKAIAIAAALESLHMASLIHDDVIDEANTRHGKPTLHSHHGNKFAIYSGDYLFCVCFTILSRYATSLSHLELNSRSMERILTGELDQMNTRYQTTVSIKNYLSRISGKTAQLFAVSCYSGAVQSDASRKEAMIAWNMGKYIGMAFQIVDDILDYTGSPETLGKPVMNDIRQGIYTLPIIYTIEQNRSTLLPILQKKETITEEEIAVIMKLISQERSVEKAIELANKYTHKALKEMSKLPDGEYKSMLRDLTTSLLIRNC